MINILSSDALEAGDAFNPTEREPRERNVDWLIRNIPSDNSNSVLVMVGGKSKTDFRLRIAQSQVRSDLSPSKWSHVMLLKGATANAQSKVVEISLEPPNGFGFPAEANGLQEGDLRHYDKPKEFPNIAVLLVPVPLEEIEKALKRFTMQRTILDGVDLIVRWLAYVWGVGRSGNPLLDGFGIPSAAMLEVVVGANGFDLTPGLESRSSCPEAISQAAKYWQQHYEKQNKEALSGFYWSPHDIK